MAEETKEKSILTELDQAARTLLRNAFPDNIGNSADAEAPDLTEQVKAFDAVSRYFGPRSKLALDGNQESQFGQLKAALHSGGSRRRRSRPTASYTASNGKNSGDAGPDGMQTSGE